ncbi:MAG: cytochrome-c peroxidase [Planctomyces sp.]|nr:cytochrome-c peroxidase [Planctomyces sp.]
MKKTIFAFSTSILVMGGFSFLLADEPAVPFGLPALEHPEDNPPTPEKIELGKLLYFDPRLSRNNDISCATCHDPNKGWSNGEPNAAGFEGKRGDRNSPTVINSAYYTTQFWDGRAATLEHQALGPIANPIEMNMSLDEAIGRIQKSKGYQERFQQVFGSEPSPELVAKAIAAFERTVLSGNAPYDKYVAGDETAMSESAVRGWKLFKGAANCSACHSGANFTDNAFHNIGVGVKDGKNTDVGRFAVSNLEGDTGAFKTPTLREIARTGPYMHNGSMETLEEVVQHYNKGGNANPYLDEEIFELGLSEQDIADLVTFMKEGLSSEDYPLVEAPTDLPD